MLRAAIYVVYHVPSVAWRVFLARRASCTHVRAAKAAIALVEIKADSDRGLDTVRILDLAWARRSQR